MRIIPLKCGQCSAPLDVPADREQLTCMWCGSILHVSRLERRPASPAGAETGPPRSELDRLDAEWDEYQSTWLPQASSGEYVVPEPEACRMGAWLTGIIGGGVALLGLAAGNWFFAGLPLVAAGGTIAVLLRQARVAPVYQRSLETYHRERKQILSRMQSETSSATGTLGNRP